MELTLLIFFIFVILISCLQFLNRRLLRQILHPSCDYWITTALIIIHSPLILYASMRSIGIGSKAQGLQLLARLGVSFQLLTVMLLLVWGTSNIIWLYTNKLQNKNLCTLENNKRRRFLQKTSIMAIVLTIFCIIHGSAGAKLEPEITYHELKFPNLPPGLDGLRIVQISDLHAGPIVQLEQVKKWRYLAEKMQPELLLITGDIVDSLPSEAKIVAEAFSNFCAPLGCFAILGNHDYFTNPYPIWETLSNVGIQFLENRNALISRNGDNLAIIGLQDPMAKHKRFLKKDSAYGSGPQPTTAMRDIPKNAWRLCIIHRPSDWCLAKQTSSLLTLCGHTHGGQVNFIPGVSSALLLGKQYTSGLYKEGQYQLYVNRGLGVVALPMRIAATPEIAVITLRRE